MPRYAILFLACAALMNGLPVGSQEDCGDFDTLMVIVDERDLRVLIESFEQAALTDEVSDLLDAGDTVNVFGFDLDHVAPNGDRTYKGYLGFQDGATKDAVFWDYTNREATPQVPTDSIDVDVTCIDDDTSGMPTLIPDLLSFDFLLHVFDELPEILIDKLNDRDLTSIWLEHEQQPHERVLSYWKYTDSVSSTTVRVWADVDSNGNFGPLNID